MSVGSISASDLGSLLEPRERVAAAVREILSAFELDLDDPQLRRTPERVSEMFAEFFAGVGVDPVAALGSGFTAPEGTDVVVMRDLRFRSICAHHLLPFDGTVDIAYEPAERVFGLGGIARVLEILSARPTLQERLAHDIADALVTGGAAGALVRVSARHSCVADRGPLQQTSLLIVENSSGSLRAGDRRRQAEQLLSAPRH